MKRFFSCLLALIMTAGFLFSGGCSLGGGDDKLSVKDSLDANHTSLKEELKAAVSFDDVADFLARWAKENHITVKTKNDKYIVLSVPASEKAKENHYRSMTIHCPINLSRAEESYQLAAAAMTTLYSAEEHGKLTAVFTSQVKGESVGAAALNTKYLKADSLVDLRYSKEPVIDPKIAASSEIEMSHKLKHHKPEYTKAYKIEMEGVSYKSAYRSNGLPNPITVIGDVLASCQSSGVLFELAGFRGGDKSALLPSKASAVIVLQENDVENFIGRFDRSYEKISETYKKAKETFTYKITETDLPGQVIEKQDSANIVSLMYTLINGTYLRSDKGDLIAASNIGKVSTENDRFVMRINAKSLDPLIMDEMKGVFETTGGLSDISYKERSSTPAWEASENSPLSDMLLEKASVSAGVLENSDASVFISKNTDDHLILCGLRKKNASKQIDTFLEYMAGADAVQQ